MDKKQHQSKDRNSGSLSSAEQQAQLAMLQQLGMPLDPSLMAAYGLPPGMDVQQLLNPMATGGYPFMNPSALQAFTGLGSLGGGQGSGGAAEWWTLAQNQALAASLGAGYFPGMLPGFPMVQTSLPQDGKSTPQESSNGPKSKDKKQSYDKISPRPDSRSSPSISRLQQDRKSSRESINSSSIKDRPESRHSTSSPFRTGVSKQSDSNTNASSWMDSINSRQQQKLNEQVFQAELMRQLEQQFMLQQLQLQQQDQMNAAMQSLMGGSIPGTSSSKKASSDSDKMQQQLAAMMQLLMQPGGAAALQGMSPSMAASLFSTPEAMMGLSQMTGLNSISGVGNLENLKLHDDIKSASSSQLNAYMNSPSSSKNQKFSSSPVPTSSKKRERSSSPRKTQQSDSNSFPSNIPPGLSPDNALLAMLYSQQLQYDELIKQHLDAVNKLREEDSKSAQKELQKSSKFSANQELSRLSGHHTDLAAYIRSNLHSPANSTSSKGRTHSSPTREYSKSPSRKSREPERSQSRGSSSKHISPPRKPTSSKDHSQADTSEMLKLFSALVSNPNMTQQDLAALLAFPTTADPTSLLSGMGPAQLSATAGLLDPALSAGQMTPAELEKMNKNLAIALDVERRRLEEQVRQQLQAGSGLKKVNNKDNHISVIHQNSLKSNNMFEPSSSRKLENRVHGKRSYGENHLDTLKLGNGDVSSDCDVRSEASTDRNLGSSGKKSRKRRRMMIDLDEIMEPTKHGWKRETRVKLNGDQFISGEVLYIAPCEKTLQTLPDVIKHLEDNEITALQRNNFSFDPKLRVGKFYEQKEKDDDDLKEVEMNKEELDQLFQRITDDRQTSSPFPDNSDQMSNYSSSSKGDSKPSREKNPEKERQREQLRLYKEREELRLKEQQRLEREFRERLALEELERQRVAEALERDQRRQQMLLMRALESRKRAEERERRKEEIRIEKMMQREKKMEQRRIAMQIARELRMPVEDMSTIGAPKLPDLTRLQGTYDNKCPHQLSGNACADLLMVLEFIKTFRECIRLDDAILPNFEKLQLGLLNDPMHTNSLVRVTMALLHQCLCDPGVPAPGPWLHCLTGVKVTDIDVREDNYSEILRLFIWARSGYKTEISLRLETLTFLSLSSDEKATCLAFLVNELVCSRPICMEIEKNLDAMATLRRDKWMVEGQMRQLRVAYERNPAIDLAIFKVDDDENSSNSFSSKSDPKAEQIKEEPVEESSESLFQKRMEELIQQHNTYSLQLATSSKPLRAHDLGQDRYKRRYWVLPNLGGVYVEGLESGISYEDDDESPDEDDDDEDEEESKDRISDQKPQTMEVDQTEKQIPKDTEEQVNKISENDALHITDNGIDESKEEVTKVGSPDKLQIPNDLSDVPSSEQHAQPATLQQDSSRENGACDTQSTTYQHNINSLEPETQNLTTSTMVNHDSGLAPDFRLNADAKEEQNLLNPLISASDAVPVETDVSEIGAVGKKYSEISPEVNSTQVQPSQMVQHSTLHNDTSSGAKSSDRSLVNEENDKVVAAAKAIAAKAVASSSHLLFPDGSPSPTKTKPKKETDDSPSKSKDKKAVVHDGANSGLPIGEHTISALVQMGVNPTSLTSQQLEVLSHLDIPVNMPTDMKDVGVLQDSAKKILDQASENTSTKQQSSTQSSEPNCNENETENTVLEEPRKKSRDQDSPMDLSRPLPSQTPNEAIAESSSAVKSIKTEPSQRDSPFMPVRDSPDQKALDSNKFFVPIPNPSSTDVKMETQQYNQVMSACPSPNTLANYIVSSVNYGNFPALDDIKFPIRAPDVKEEPDIIPRERKRGWWRIETESELRSLSEKLHLRGIREKQLHRNITKNFDICTNSMTVSAMPEHQFAVLTKDSAMPAKVEEKPMDEEGQKVTQTSSEERRFDTPSRFVTSENLAYEAEMQVLYQVEELSARCVNMGVVSPQWRNDNPKPSMARKDLTHVPLGPLRDAVGVEIKFDALNPIYHDPKSVLGASVEFLGCLERAVCRRYLKPPLVRKGGASEFSSLPSLSESGAMDVAAGLRTWRNAVASSSSASQLSLCIRMLEACIAWDRSANQSPTKEEASPLTKAKKRKPDKRATKVLLPSDSPKPKKRKKKQANPHKNNASIQKESKKARMPIDTADVISKSGVSPLTNGEICNDIPEDGASGEVLDNFEDSVTSLDSNSEYPVKNGPEGLDLGQELSPSQYHTNSDTGNISEEYRPSSEPKKKKKKKKKMKLNSKDEEPKKSKKPRKRADKDTAICRSVLRELQSHEDATWFLFPVDCKLVPGYRKIIKKPIDFHTIESRLKRGRYKSKEEFVCEVRLVFDNCQKFNEDDSNIGRAGHQIRNFFEKRWTEILREKYGESPSPSPAEVHHPLPISDHESNSIQEPESEPVSESASYPDSESGLIIDDS